MRNKTVSAGRRRIGLVILREVAGSPRAKRFQLVDPATSRRMSGWHCEFVREHRAHSWAWDAQKVARCKAVGRIRLLLGRFRSWEVALPPVALNRVLHCIGPRPTVGEGVPQGREDALVVATREDVDPVTRNAISS